MSTLYQQAESNMRKTWLLVSVFLGLILSLGWFFSRIYDAPGILLIAVIISSFMSVASYWWSDTIVLAMNHARQVSKADAPELYRIVENLAITMGLPTPRVCIVPTSSLNAFATGRDPAHGVVAITSGLLQALEKTELEGVLAHEMSHIGNRDTLVMAVVSVLVGVIVYAADWFLRMSFWGGGRRNNDRKGGGNGVLLIVGLVLAILSPIMAQVAQLAISRKREFLADATGALTTRYPEGLARALEKISRAPVVEFASAATAHFYIASPLTSKKEGGQWFSRLFMTHPPVSERIAILRGMKV